MRSGLCVRIESLDKVELILLDLERILVCDTVAVLINVAVELALRLDALFLARTVNIGVSDRLHDKNCVCEVNFFVAVSVAPESNLAGSSR